MAQCKETTRNGARCKRKATHGVFCASHKKAETKVEVVVGTQAEPKVEIAVETAVKVEVGTQAGLNVQTKAEPVLTDLSDKDAKEVYGALRTLQEMGITDAQRIAEILAKISLNGEHKKEHKLDLKKVKEHDSFIFEDMHSDITEIKDGVINPMFKKYLYILPYRTFGQNYLYLVSKTNVERVDIKELNPDIYNLLSDENGVCIAEGKDAMNSIIDYHDLKFDYFDGPDAQIKAPLSISVDIEVYDHDYDTEKPKFPDISDADRFIIGVISTSIMLNLKEFETRTYFLTDSTFDDTKIEGYGKNRIACYSEQEMAIRFVNLCKQLSREYGYVILTGFNISVKTKNTDNENLGTMRYKHYGFDLPFIFSRLHRNNNITFSTSFSKLFGNNTASKIYASNVFGPRVIIVDCLEVMDSATKINIKCGFVQQLNGKKLADFAQAYGVSPKLDMDIKKMNGILRDRNVYGENNLETVLKYCERDALICNQLLAHPNINFIANSLEIARKCETSVIDKMVFSEAAALNSKVHRELYRAKHKFRYFTREKIRRRIENAKVNQDLLIDFYNKKYGMDFDIQNIFIKPKPYKGATNLDVKPFCLSAELIAVLFDFRALYPSVILLWRISPANFIGEFDEVPEEYKNDGYVILENKGDARDETLKNYIIFKNCKCPILKFIERLLVERMHLQRASKDLTDVEIKNKLELEQVIVKLLVNSIYGLNGNNSQFYSYNRVVAASVTLAARICLNTAKEALTSKELERFEIKHILSGDTDSLFFALSASKQNEISDLTTELNNYIRNKLNKHERFEKEDTEILYMKYEKTMQKYYVAKKKTYACIDNKGKFETSGLQFSQLSPYVKETTLNLIRKLLEVLNLCAKDTDLHTLKLNNQFKAFFESEEERAKSNPADYARTLSANNAIVVATLNKANITPADKYYKVLPIKKPNSKLKAEKYCLVSEIEKYNKELDHKAMIISCYGPNLIKFFEHTNIKEYLRNTVEQHDGLEACETFEIAIVKQWEPEKFGTEVMRVEVDELKEMLADNPKNIVYHERLVRRDNIRLFFDIDCKITGDKADKRFDVAEFENVLMDEYMIPHSAIEKGVRLYAPQKVGDEIVKISYHLVYKILTSCEYMQRLSKQLKRAFPTVDTSVYDRNHNLRTPLCGKYSTIEVNGEKKDVFEKRPFLIREEGEDHYRQTLNRLGDCLITNVISKGKHLPYLMNYETLPSPLNKLLNYMIHPPKMHNTNCDMQNAKIDQTQQYVEQSIPYLEEARRYLRGIYGNLEFKVNKFDSGYSTHQKYNGPKDCIICNKFHDSLDYSISKTIQGDIKISCWAALHDANIKVKNHVIKVAGGDALRFLKYSEREHLRDELPKFKPCDKPKEGYIDFEIKPNMLNFVRAPMGAGKSYVLSKYIKEAKPHSIVVVSFRRTFSTAMLKRLNDALDNPEAKDQNKFASYMDIQGRIELNKMPYVICQYESLSRINMESVGNIQLLIIDEIESAIDQIAGADKDFIEIFKKIITRSKTIVCMDALLSQWSIDLIRVIKDGKKCGTTPCNSITYEFASNFEHKAKIYLTSKAKTIAKPDLEYLKSEEYQALSEEEKQAKLKSIKENKFAINELTVLSDIKLRLDKGENVYCSIGYRSLIYKIEAMAKELGYSIMCYHGGDLEQSDGKLMAQKKMEDFKDINEKIKQVKPRLFVASMTLSAGVSIDVLHFHSFVCYFCSDLSPIALLQSTNRCRTYLHKEGSIYMYDSPFVNNDPLDYNDVLSSSKLSKKKAPEYYKCLAAVMLRDHMLKVNFTHYMLNELLAMGFLLDTSGMASGASAPYVPELEKFIVSKKTMLKDLTEDLITIIGKPTEKLPMGQIVALFEEKAKELRKVKEPDMDYLKALDKNDGTFKMRTDLPLNINEIIQECRWAKKYNLSIKEYLSLSKTQLLGLLSISSKLRRAVNWEVLKFPEKAAKLQEQGIVKIRAALRMKAEAAPITSPDESIELQQERYKEAIAHDKKISAANDVNMTIKDNMQMKFRIYADLGVKWISLVRDEFQRLPKETGLLEEEIYKICDDASNKVPNIDKFFINVVGTRKRDIAMKTAYYEALKMAGIDFNIKRERKDKSRKCYRYVKIGEIVKIEE